MKLLKEQFNFKGYTLTQTLRTDVGFIYTKTFGDTIISFEVFRVKISNPSQRLMGSTLVTFEEAERYPSDTDFGVWAYDCKTLEKAHQYLTVFAKPLTN